MPARKKFEGTAEGGGERDGEVGRVEMGVRTRKPERGRVGCEEGGRELGESGYPESWGRASREEERLR